MADEIKINIDWENLRERKKWLDAYIGKTVMKLVNTVTLATQKHIRQDLFGVYPGGTTATTLSTRSGKLKKSVVNIPATREGDIIRGAIGIGTVYGRVHFGKAGQVTTIRPVRAGALAIPLPAAMDSHGVARGSPRDKSIYGETFLGKSKAGNMIIFGKLLYVKGAKSGQAKGGLKPLFVLKQSVSVPSRIHPEDLRAFVQPLLGKGMADIKAGLEGSSVNAD